MSTLKKRSLFLEFHLYLGLVAGVVVSIMCFTGAMLEFEKELLHVFNPSRYYVTVPASAQPLPADTLLAQTNRWLAAQTDTTLQGREVQGITVPGDPGMAWQMNLNGRGAPSLFVNPYTGEVTGQYRRQGSFFDAMFRWHRWLAMGDTGKVITGASTLLFLVILLTGIIEWWPRTKAQLKQRLKVKWNAGWKRLNNDLHVSLGFYTALFLFVFAFTALFWSYRDTYIKGIYAITGTERVNQKPVKLDSGVVRPPVVAGLYTRMIAQTVEQSGPYHTLSLNLPEDTLGAVSVRVLPESAPHERAADQYFYHPTTGAPLKARLYKDQNAGQKLSSMMFPLHTGSIAGMPGRIIGFLACMIGATFIVSGVILYINRLLKNARRKRGLQVAEEE